jgi:hypothetical protein
MEEFKDSVLACKSQAVYEKWYGKYAEFKEKNNCQDDNEDVFIGFLMECKKSYCASSLWQARVVKVLL